MGDIWIFFLKFIFSEIENTIRVFTSVAVHLVKALRIYELV